MSQLKKGAVLSYITIFITNIIGLLLTPFIISKLGDAEYGLYTLIGAFVGYIGVLDFGLNNAIVRFVAKYKAEKDKKGEENFLATAMLIYSVIAILIVIIGGALYFNLESIFTKSLTFNELGKAKVMFLILIFNLAITLPGGAFTAICTGYEHFVFPRGVNIIKYVVRSALVVGILIMGSDAIGLVLLDTVMNLLVIVVNGWFVFKRLKVIIKLHQFKISLVKEVFSYSIWVFVFVIVNQLRWQAGQLVLVLIFSTSAVAVYAVAVTLGTYYGAFSSAIASLLLPRATQMVIEKASAKELTEMFIKISRLILIVLLYIFGGFVLVGREFIYFWVGDFYSEIYFYVIFIMLGLTLILSQGFANNILEAKNTLRFRGIIMLSFAILGLILGSILAKTQGGLGMILGGVLFMFFERIIMTWYYSKFLHLEMFKYYLRIAPLFLILAITVAVDFYIFSFFDSYKIIFFILKIILYSINFAFLFWFILEYSEKRIAQSLVLGFLKKKK